jgi:D-alanyl-lipoteichoic acid acyltransferase DltB (MBOAT superfamily)
MSVCSTSFVLLLLATSAAFFWIPTVRLRQAFLALANFGFLYSQVPNAAAWIALAAFLIIGFALARLLHAHPHRWLLAVYIAGLVSAFLVLKRYEFLQHLLPAPLLAHTLVIVGISYMLFRQIHVAVDAMQGQIEHLSFWTYINYQANLFGLLAGPIQRYQEFATDWDVLEPVLTESYDIVAAYRRIFLGVIKVSIISAACLAYYNYFSGAFLNDSYQPAWKAAVKFALIFYLYPAYVYFNFSGYCDIVIAGASLVGLRMPENFDYPFLARNMIEYWTRWHRTLGFWIRDYIFTPLYKAIAVNWPQSANSLAFLCYFTALFLAGIWHGSTWNFVIFGLLNGIGVSAAKLWENWILARSGRQGLRTYLQSRSIRAFAIVANIHYVCLTLFFFPSDLAGSFKTLAGFAHAFAF